MAAAANRRAGIAILPLNGFGMLYGGLATSAYVFITPVEWGWDGSPAYAFSLLYLILVGTIAGFWCFLTVVGRVGPERASFIPVLFPLVALAVSTVAEGYAWPPLAVLGIGLVLAVSTVAEGYAWPPLAVLGIGLVLAGNVVVLARPAGAEAGLRRRPKLWSRPVTSAIKSRPADRARSPLGRTTA